LKSLFGKQLYFLNSFQKTSKIRFNIATADPVAEYGNKTNSSFSKSLFFPIVARNL
jgi:hypothetical protein